MRSVGFRAAHWQFAGTLTEDLLDGHGLGAVVELRGAGVGVDVIDLFGRELGVGEGVAHGANAGFATRQRRSHVERVVVQTVAEHFRENVGAALLRVFQLLNHK
jgi:hypothetical protein